MCDPVTAMTIASIGSSVVQFAEGQQQAKMTNKRNAAARLQITNARDDKNRQSAQQTSQLQGQKAQEKMDKNIEAMELTSRAALSASEAGVGGRVVDAVMTKYERDRLTSNTNINADIDNLGIQGMYDRRGIEAEAQSQINQYQPVKGPSVLGLVAEIGMAGANHKYMKSGGVPKSTPPKK